MKYVYHGSQKQNLKKITKRKSTHGQEWVYATSSKVIATIFISNKASDLNYYLGGKGTNESPIILVERKIDMFKNIFNLSGSLYSLSSKNFLSNKTGWSAEVISEYDEDVIEEEHIGNVYDKLVDLNNKKDLKLYLYPNRPNFLPLDNSDLIPKVKKWEKAGFDIEIFLEIYPELKEKYNSYTNDEI